MTVNELADYLKVVRSTVYYLIKEKDLPVFYISDKSPRFKKEAIKEWINDQTVKEE